MRPALLAAPLLMTSIAANAQPLAAWQVETLLPAACIAANIPSRDCLCLLDALERRMNLGDPATGDGRTGVPPRAGAGHAEAVVAALRACAPGPSSPPSR